MNETVASFVTTFVPVLGRALLHFLWQGALIGLVAAVLLHVLRGARPQARYAVACFALLACALAPVLDIAWQLANTPDVAMSTIGAPAPVAMAALGNTTQAIAQTWNFDDAMPMLVSIWASGACALLLRMALGMWWIQRLCRTPQDGVAATWQTRLDALAARFGLKRPVALRLVGAIASPASVGWWRPVVLLPSALLARMPVELVEALLAHELAHIRRHDYLVNLVQSAVEALLFHHPVTWWLSHRIRIEREQIADQLAADVIGEPRRLALALSELSDSLAPNAPTERLPSLALAAHGGQLMSRIEHLVRPALRRSSGGRIAFPLLGLAVAGIALIAHAQVAVKPQVAVTPRVAPSVNAVPVVRTQLAVRDDDPSRISYALVRKGTESMTMSGDTRDIDGIKAIRQGMDRDFLWVRKDGKAWVITDPAILDRVRQAWAGMEPLDRQMEAFDAQMDVHDRKMEALDARMDQLSALQEDSPEMEAASRRMDELGQQQETLAAKQEALADRMANADSARQEQLSREMESLSAQQEALSGKMEAQSRIMESESARMQRNAQPMEALGQQMEEAGKPMEALGKQMDVLGQRMDAMSKQAERDTLKLIDEAMAQGLASPAPVRR